MTTLEHPVSPEEIMAMLDEELSVAERQAVMEHIAQCAECAAVRDRIESTSRAMSAWSVPAIPETLDRVVEQAVGSRPRRMTWKPRSRSRVWLVVSGGVLATLVLTGLLTNVRYRRLAPTATYSEQKLEPTADALAANSQEFDRLELSAKLQSPSDVSGGARPASAPAPMIARNVALTLQVKNIPSARAALDAILASHSGYAANLTINTPDAGARSFQASLRIPAPQLEAALTALRGIGQVETETQSGEEVTPQHADLVIRLLIARETEDRLRDILAHRAGKMDEVLQVEEQISQIRGEIEQMEAEQKALEHRVDYATVDLQLTEQYEAQLTGRSASVGTQLRNSLVIGIRNAGSSLLGLALFLEEVGPALLVWIAILAVPAWVGWRRYRRAQTRF